MLQKADIIELSYQHPIIFFDGVCHLCEGTVQKLLKWDKNKIFRFATLQYASDQQLIDTSFNSIILMDKGETFHKSDALIKILSILGGKYLWLATFTGLFPKGIRDFGYDIIAKYRFRWFGKYDTCMLPDESHKARFLIS